MFCTTILILNPNICFWIFMCVVLTLVRFNQSNRPIYKREKFSSFCSLHKCLDKCVWNDGSVGPNHWLGIVHRTWVSSRIVRRLCCSCRTYIFSNWPWDETRSSIKHCYAHCASCPLWWILHFISRINASQFWGIYIPSIFQSKFKTWHHFPFVCDSTYRFSFAFFTDFLAGYNIWVILWSRVLTCDIELFWTVGMPFKFYEWIWNH